MDKIYVGDWVFNFRRWNRVMNSPRQILHWVKDGEDTYVFYTDGLCEVYEAGDDVLKELTRVPDPSFGFNWEKLEPFKYSVKAGDRVQMEYSKRILVIAETVSTNDPNLRVRYTGFNSFDRIADMVRQRI